MELFKLGFVFTLLIASCVSRISKSYYPSDELSKSFNPSKEISKSFYPSDEMSKSSYPSKTIYKSFYPSNEIIDFRFRSGKIHPSDKQHLHLYPHSDWKGTHHRYELEKDSGCVNVYSSDVYSSVKQPGEQCSTFYVDKNCRGAHQRICGSKSKFGEGLMDKISSLMG